MGNKGNKTHHSFHCHCYTGDTNVKGSKSGEQMVMNWPFYRRNRTPPDYSGNVVQEQPSSESLGIKKTFSNRVDVYQQN